MAAKVRANRKQVVVVVDRHYMAILHEAYPLDTQSEVVRMAVRRLAEELCPPTVKPPTVKPKHPAARPAARSDDETRAS